jgi:hypothetical protein
MISALLIFVATGAAVKVARAEGAQERPWQLDITTESVTPTSHFTGSARFVGPGRRYGHHHRRHQLPYNPYSEVPDGYVLQETSIKPLVWSGVLLVGIPYAVGITYAVLADFPGDTGFLAIPLAGPWLARSQESDRAARVALGLDGLVQASGAVLLTLGLTFTRKQWVPYDMANVWVMPTATARGQVGLTAGGTF